MPKAVVFITAGLLFIGVLPLPYSYYTLLRLVACGVFAWAAFITYEKSEKIFPWIFVVLAVVFNPFVKLHFPKELWIVIDFSAGLFLLLVSKKLIHDGPQCR